MLNIMCKKINEKYFKYNIIIFARKNLNIKRMKSLDKNQNC